MSIYSIKDLERLSGIRAPTIRIWEKRYGIIEPKRSSTNIRYYEDQDLRKLINLATLNRKGYRISQLAEMDEEQLGKKALEYCLQHQEEDDRCHLLTQAMLRIDEREFDLIFDRLVGDFGFEDTIIYHILPFLKKVGVLWHTGAIDPAQEHFVSQLIRRKLMSAIEESERPDEEAPCFLMFLPEGELHDIGLLISFYLARKKGFRVCYLGTSVPDRDLEKVAQQYHYPALLTAFIDSLSQEKPRKKIQNYLSFFPSSRLIVTGPQVQKGDADMDDRVHVIESVEAFRELLREEQGKEVSLQ